MYKFASRGITDEVKLILCICSYVKSRDRGSIERVEKKGVDAMFDRKLFERFFYMQSFEHKKNLSKSFLSNIASTPFFSTLSIAPSIS